MFKDIVPDDGAALQALVAFIITFAVFSIIIFRAWHMRSEEATRMSSLPLDDEPKTNHTS